MYSPVFLCFNIFCFFCRLRDAGLLTLSRLVEVGPIQLDRSLLTALVDRWRPEKHTFHLPCGEMTPTLQDVAYLLGLPIVGEAVGPRVVAALLTLLSAPDLYTASSRFRVAFPLEYSPKVYQYTEPKKQETIY